MSFGSAAVGSTAPADRRLQSGALRCCFVNITRPPKETVFLACTRRNDSIHNDGERTC
jgi:hypothetical protein